MYFQTGHLYHIFNQGNNKQNIFYNRVNYLFFLQKINLYILPYCDILAWCLMPNHFHLMVLVNFTNKDIAPSDALGENLTKRTYGNIGTETIEGIALSDTLGGEMRSINQSIGLMLRSYTNAINKQQHRSGSLFRKKTKAECISCSDEITPSFIHTSNGTMFLSEMPERQDPQICYSYILNNPVSAGLVKTSTDWEFSSAMDVKGLRNGKLIKREVIKEYGLVF